MNAREYLEKQAKNQQITFVIARAVKDEATPFYHYEYRTTPIRAAWEWLREDGSGRRFGDNYLVINADHPPVDITGLWVRNYKAGHLSCAVLTTEADLRTMYSEKQAADMIAYYNKTVK